LPPAAYAKGSVTPNNRAKGKCAARQRWFGCNA
jgi:hypothetical protein